MNFFDNKLMQTLCWTLVHSLWQGLLLSLIAGMVILCTKKSAVVLRYNLLTGLLIAFILAGAGTFYYEVNLLHSTTGALLTEQGSTALANSNEVTQPIVSTSLSSGNILTSIVSFLNAHSNSIVLVWLFIILIKCIQLVAGFRGMYLLKHIQTSSTGEYWTNRVHELAIALNIQKPVKLLQSALAKVPMVAGHLKPVILLPAGLLTSLPADEIEAILLHELAHIRRRDYLVNMLQSFCEILYFFNPAVLWLSALIKDERENCCDDIAIGQMKNKKQFIHALIAFQEYNLTAGQVALAFPGNRYRLLNRVNRILTNTNKTLNTMEKSLLASGLLLTSFLVVAFTQNNEIPARHKKEQPVVKSAPVILLNDQQLVQDTVPAKEKNYTYNVVTTFEGKEYKFKVVNDKVSELYVDGEKIPDDKIADYKKTTDKIIVQVKEQAKKAKEQAEVARKQVEKSREQINLAREEVQKSLRKLEQMQIDAEKAQLQALEANLAMEHSQEQMNDRENAERLHESKELLRLQGDLLEHSRIDANRRQDETDQARGLMEKTLLHQQNSSLRLLERARLQAGRDQERALLLGEKALRHADDTRIRAERSRLLSEQHFLQSERSRLWADASHQRTERLIKDIIEDLIDAGVIKNGDGDISFKLNEKELIVNGVKQPGELQKKLADKYVKDSPDHINYSRNGNSTNTDIHIEKKQEDKHED